jgi:hypothetical protein
VVGAFCRTLGGHTKFKRFENPFPNQTNPLQTKENQPKQYTHTPFSRFVCVTIKKMEKIGVLGSFGIERNWGEKGKWE